MWLKKIGFFFVLAGVLTSHAQTPSVLRSRLGQFTHAKLKEISGIIPSVAFKDHFWVHNDSGDDANVYLIDSQANLVCTYQLEGIQARDIEEMAWLYIDGRYHIILGDIGDNRGSRDRIRFYFFKEPDHIEGDHQPIKQEDIQVFNAKYPDRGRDAEAFFVDPWSNELFLITKREFHVHVYSLDFLNHQGGEECTAILKKELELPLFFITAADISSDGKDILIKNLKDIFLYKRNKNERVVDALRKVPMKLAYKPELQGEAIAFDRIGKSFYTASERPFGLDSYLYQYQIIFK